MRASTLFALTVAVLVGLGVAVAARLSGYFSTPEKKQQDPVIKKPEILVLVAGRNLFANDLIDSANVRVRPLRADELEYYQQNKDNFLPPVLQSVYLRIASKNIEVDQPILRSSLKEMAKPDALNARMLPRMRATTLSLPKERSAGGMIQVGEWVDVLLTTKIERPGFSTVRTACIVPHVRVIAKRNSLWPIFASLPEDKPVSFTLELNPYRAALLDFCLNKGQLTLAPLPASEQKKLEARRVALLEHPEGAQPVHFVIGGDIETNDEEGRVDSFNRGELVVSERDLVRIFDVKLSASTNPPPLATTSIERLAGLQRFPSAVFTLENVPVPQTRGNAGARPLQKSQLQNGTSELSFSEPYCATCADKKKSKGK
jgi:Flp pilus assembly protein CpaB